MFVVPIQGTGIRTLTFIVGNDDLLTVKFVVVPAVFELFSNTPAHLKLKIGGNGYVAQIKQAMYVATQKQSISRFMLTTIAIGTNMCRL